MVSMEPPQPSTGLTCSCDGVTTTPTLSVGRKEGPFRDYSCEFQMVEQEALDREFFRLCHQAKPQKKHQFQIILINFLCFFCGHDPWQQFLILFVPAG